MTRRRKTPETPVASKLRAYAAQYKASGQGERALGMAQAADIVDELASKGELRALPPLLEDPAAVTGTTAGALARRLDDVVRRLAPLEAYVLPRVKAKGKLRVQANGMLRAATPEEVAEAERVVEEEQRRAEAERQAELAERTPAELDAEQRAVMGIGPAPRASEHLILSELRILAACEHFGQRGCSYEELTAVTDYRMTSLRTYLGNLRAAGCVETVQGHHRVVPGSYPAHRLEEYAPLVGRALLERRLEELPSGERKILEYVARKGETTATDIGEATAFKKTSVRTYVNELRRKCLVFRKPGSVYLAPILIDEYAREVSS